MNWFSVLFAGLLLSATVLGLEVKNASLDNSGLSNVSVAPHYIATHEAKIYKLCQQNQLCIDYYAGLDSVLKMCMFRKVFN